MKLLLQPPIIPSIVGSNSLFSTKSHKPSVCGLPLETNFHTHNKTTGKIISFYILIFTFFTTDRTTKVLN
jgi:hypothetical protein